MSEKPRVAILRHQLFLPSETFVVDQARALRAFEPLLIGRQVCGTPPADLAWQVPESSRARLLSYVLLRNPGLIRDLAARHRPDLLHAHFGVEAVYGYSLARALKLPMVATFHGFDATMSRRRLLTAGHPSWIQYLLGRNGLRRSGASFIAVSDFIRSRLLELGFPENRIHRHYIGIDTALFDGPRPAADTLEILHVARLVEKKGTADLLQAFAQVAGRHRDLRLVVIGDGPLRGALQERSAALGIAGQVRWLGARPHAEVRRQMARSALFCLPSCTAPNGDAEGLGLVLLEAAATGLPVIGTHHGGIPEAVEDEKTGYLVPERRPDKLAEALEALIGSAALRDRLGQAARDMVRRRFDIHRQTRELEAIYARAA